jgi:hypothetical protein
MLYVMPEAYFICTLQETISIFASPLSSYDCQYTEHRGNKKKLNKLYIFHSMRLKKNHSFNEYLNYIIQQLDKETDTAF